MTGGYEDARRKLEERGYLHGPLERFVLGGGATEAGVGRLAGAGARAALVGGPILGALLAGGVVATNAPILAAADGLVLWLYFSLLGAAGLFVLLLAAGSATAALAARRGLRPRDRLTASLVAGVPALAYAILLWQGGARPAGSWADLLFLAAAVATALLLARLGGLVSLAGIIGRTGQIPDRARRPIFALVAILVPLAAVLLSVRWGDGRNADRAPVPASRYELASAARPLVFIGVDGLDGAIVEEFERSGSLERLLARFQQGAVFPVRRRPDREPAEVWTTIATGMGVEAHGVAGAGAERLPGVATLLRTDAGPRPLRALLRFALPTRTVPTTGAARRVRTVWEVAASKVPVAAVGWWASWPAPGDGDALGYVVTDRVLPKLLANAHPDRDTAPAALFARLQAEFEPRRAELHREFDQRFGKIDDADVSRIAWESFLIDGWNEATAEWLTRDDSLRGMFVYLPGLDLLRVRLRGLAAGERRSRAGAAAVGAYVDWLDSALERLCSRGSDWRTMLVADPGRSAVAASEGFVHLAGEGVSAGCVGPTSSDLDVAPMALALLGLPASRELPGADPASCVDFPLPPRVATFGRKPVPSGVPEGAEDPEILERLRSLGYLR